MDTIECVKSIVSNVSGEYNIIVVNNGSPNNSYGILELEFQKKCYSRKVVLLNSEKNLGFAKGNNIGYLYAKNILKSDFIFCINNDTIIKQPDFCDMVCKVYFSSEFDVMGPDIISTRDGKHQNPLGYYEPLGIDVLIKMSVKLFFLWLRDAMGFTKVKLPKKVRFDEPYDLGLKDSNRRIKLMGAAICFSKSYIEKYNYAFDPITFMYREEDFLAWLIDRDNLKAIYTNDIVLYHKEFSSTETSMEYNVDSQNAFKYKNMLISTFKLIYRKYINKNVEI